MPAVGSAGSRCAGAEASPLRFPQQLLEVSAVSPALLGGTNATVTPEQLSNNSASSSLGLWPHWEGRHGATALLTLGTSVPVLGSGKLRLCFNACHCPWGWGIPPQKVCDGADFMWEVTQQLLLLIPPPSFALSILRTSVLPLFGFPGGLLALTIQGEL